MHLPMIRWGLAILILAVFVFPAAGATLLVPGQYASIQGAIDAAQPGDEIIIADGNYTGPGNKNLDLGGKPLIIRSGGGNPASCVIDCESNGRGFYFHTGETAAARLVGLTIRNGYVVNGSPGGASGGGVYCAGASPTLIDCVISGNRALPSHGGGVYCTAASSPVLVNCSITNNSAYMGGGIFCYAASNLTLVNGHIKGNTATVGGGLGCWEAHPQVINCLISDNFAGIAGGVDLRYANPTLNNCTIVANTAYSSAFTPYGGGVYCFSASPTLANCILWGNLPEQILTGGTAAPVVAYCDAQDGYAGTGNINANPLFVDPDGPDNDPLTWQDNDYRIAAHSPCIDAGRNSTVPPDAFDLDRDGNTTEATPLDLAAQPRFVDDSAKPDTGLGTPPLVDIGAYEFQPTGACCLADDTCTITTQAGCNANWLGANTTCTQCSSSPATGACCHPGTGACTITTQAECVAPATWKGSNTVCDAVTCPYLKGDLNCDRQRNVDDVPYFVAALIGGYSGCDISLADMDNSGTIDGLDIQAFIFTVDVE